MVIPEQSYSETHDDPLSVPEKNTEWTNTVFPKSARPVSSNTPKRQLSN